MGGSKDKIALSLQAALTISNKFAIMPAEGTAQRQAVGHTTRKGVRLMRITLHIGAFTVTIVVKKRENRHSAK